MDYECVIGTRYKAPILTKIWSPINKIKTMRQLWIDFAKIQKELGVKCITDNMIDELIDKRDDIDLNKIKIYENISKHDVMANIYAYADLCPNGGKIIHLAATSNDINDNVDSILVKQSCEYIYELLDKLNNCLTFLSNKYKNVPTLGYTHLQPAQLTSVGRRYEMWQSDIILSYNNLQNIMKTLPFKGLMGAVGTQEALIYLFDDDKEKASLFNEKLAKLYGFNNIIKKCGQTYSRKYDVEIMHILSSISQSIYKIMNDIRLLSGKMEIYENFEKTQIGSSAMPYKHNPINCEKICSLCRYIITQESSMVNTYINQWLERSLDDSAIKRIIFPECFLLTEYILNESVKILTCLKLNIDKINESIENHNNKLQSEKIIIDAVKKGESRQKIHEYLLKLYK